MKIKIYSGNYCSTCKRYQAALPKVQEDLPELEIEIINVELTPPDIELVGVPATLFEDGRVFYGELGTAEYKRIINNKTI